jgi:predicted small lipoprotein YifL
MFIGPLEIPDCSSVPDLREILQNKHREVAQFSSPAFTTPGTDEQSGISKGPINIPDEQKNFVKQTWWFFRYIMAREQATFR